MREWAKRGSIRQTCIPLFPSSVPALSFFFSSASFSKSSVPPAFNIYSTQASSSLVFLLQFTLGELIHPLVFMSHIHFNNPRLFFLTSDDACGCRCLGHRVRNASHEFMIWTGKKKGAGGTWGSYQIYCILYSFQVSIHVYRNTGHRSVVVVFVYVYVLVMGDMSWCARCKVKVGFLGVVAGGKKAVHSNYLTCLHTRVSTL